MTMERRSNYFIDKSFQTQFILKFCLLNILASLLTGVLIYVFNRQTKTVAFENLEIVVKSTSDFILPILLEILVVVSILVGGATIGVILFMSHKIAGPLYRLTLELEKMKAGNLSSPISIRAKDQLQKVACEFEQMRVGLRGSVDLLRRYWSAIRSPLLAFKETIKDENQRKSLEANMGEMDTELARFKTE